MICDTKTLNVSMRGCEVVVLYIGDRSLNDFVHTVENFDLSGILSRLYGYLKMICYPEKI